MSALRMELYTVAPMRQPGVGTRLGEVFARFPRFMPERVGAGDPARQAVTDLPGQLEALTVGDASSGRVDLLLASYDRDEYAWAHLEADPFRHHPPRQPLRSTVELGVEADTDGFVDLFVALAGAVSPYFGYVATLDQELQRKAFEAARRRTDPPPTVRDIAERGAAPHIYQEVCLDDVFWVQVYGPAYLERWGTDALAGIGVRQERLDDGGLVLWATEAPEFDEAVTAPEGYGWKSPVYDAVGAGRFARSDQPWGAYGERVPLMTEHAAAVPGELRR